MHVCEYPAKAIRNWQAAYSRGVFIMAGDYNHVNYKHVQLEVVKLWPMFTVILEMDIKSPAVPTCPSYISVSFHTAVQTPCWNQPQVSYRRAWPEEQSSS